MNRNDSYWDTISEELMNEAGDEKADLEGIDEAFRDVNEHKRQIEEFGGRSRD